AARIFEEQPPLTLLYHAAPLFQLYLIDEHLSGAEARFLRVEQAPQGRAVAAEGRNDHAPFLGVARAVRADSQVERSRALISRTSASKKHPHMLRRSSSDSTAGASATSPSTVKSPTPPATPSHLVLGRRRRPPPARRRPPF